jgi:ketosteroid isomerase-like protein
MRVAVDENIEKVKQAFDAYNRGDLEKYADLYADPVVVVDTATGDRTEATREEGIAETRALREAFPDHTCTIRQITAQDDRVVVRYQNEATHTGPGPFGEPTGKRVAWGAVSEYWFRDGVVSEMAFVNETWAMLKQLGFTVTAPSTEG